MGDLDIDLRDPAVQRLMGHGREESRVATGNGGRQLEQLAGDKTPAAWDDGRKVRQRIGVADPMAGVRNTEGRVGIGSRTRLDGNKIEVLVSYRGRHGQFDMTVDVYQLPESPIECVLICPKCHGGQRGAGSRISSERKRIEFDRDHGRPYTFVDGSQIVYNGGSLSIEPFECMFEFDSNERHVIGQRAGGANLCRMRMAIENSIAKDA